MNQTVELFCGTKSFSKVAAKRGYLMFTVDNEWRFDPTLCASVLDISRESLPRRVDVLWASPPCTAFSVASIGHHWTGGKRAYIPKTDDARFGIALVEKTLCLIEQIKPRYWFIENPRGVLRNLSFMSVDTLSARFGSPVYRHTVWYCRYGDRRAKPTDLWTNVPPNVWTPRPECHNGNPDHEAAPRGAKTGTQGIQGARDRGIIPPALFEEIFSSL